MKDTHRVELAFKKEPGRTVGLDYVLRPLDMAQARFKDRSVLVPELDLNAYGCVAVIDWVEIDLNLGRETQFRFLKRELDDFLGASHYAKPHTRVGGGTTRRFSVRFQEARLVAIASALERVRTVYGLSFEPEVSGLEVSIDFTPKDFSEDARAKMVGLLMWHLFPGWDYMSAEDARPRFSWKRGRSGTAHLIRWNARVKNNDDFIRFNINDRPAAVDATLYVGRRGGPLLLRVQNKTIDEQNLGAGTRVELDEKDRRARVEVSLGSEELRDLGIQHFNDLQAFKFTKMQGRYFRAMLPTFSAAADPVKRWREEQRLTKFLNTGVLGLTAMDEAIREQSATVRSDVAKRARAKGSRMSSRNRVGRGLSMTVVSF